MTRTTSRENRATLTHSVIVQLDESEYQPTTGDRKRGSSEHRPARIVGFELKYEYDPDARRWNLQGWRSALFLQQQREDLTWTDARNRRVPHEDIPAYEADWAPDSHPEVTW